MMDLSSTAAALQQIAAAAQQAQGAVTAVQAGAPVATAGMTPLQTAFTAGPVLAHFVQPLADKIPVAARPAVLGLAMAAVTAGTAHSQGTPWAQACGYGLATTFGAKIYHTLALKNGSLLSVLGGLFAGVKQASGQVTK